MRSMTGFGLGTAPLGDGRISAEIRSLNHRFLDVRVRLPVEISEHTFFVEQLARERLSRGRYDVGVRLEGAALGPPRFSVERARSAYTALRALRDELAPGQELPVSAVLGLPEVVATSSSGDAAPVEAALRAAFETALRALDAMRDQEGEALARELASRLGAARALVSAIEAESGEVVESQRARLRTRIERLVGDTAVALDPGRLELEVAILADKSDVTEELVRLSSHFDQLAELVALREPVGRRLDFLLQEIGREANTIGSKCQDAALSHRVVALKTEIERMREQVQNVE
jgi:uncharacterized protein (TIGR00255 family)